MRVQDRAHESDIDSIAFPTTQTAGEVAKRSNAADCKSVALAASKVRVLPSPPSFAQWEWVSFGWHAGECGQVTERKQGTAGLPADAPWGARWSGA